MVDIDDSSLQADSWPMLVGMRVGRHWVLFCIDQMSQLNPYNDSIINIVLNSVIIVVVVIIMEVRLNRVQVFVRI